MRTARPSVSIALPVYNAAGWIGRAIESALAQTFPDIELVVVDNASTDGTAGVARTYEDPRIRVHVNASNLGYQRNMNRAVELTTGEYVKFLHADDRLLPSCVERLLEPLESNPRVGMAFARRQVELADEQDAELLWWRERYGTLHTALGPLEAVNDGGTLLRRLIAAEFSSNWVGEPSSVMVRRACFERLGLVSTRIIVANDLEMWARIMSTYDIGFVDEELSVFRIGHSNLTRSGKHRSRDWLDRLWLLEGLARHPQAGAQFPELRRALHREQRRVAKELATTVRDDPSLLRRRASDLSRYATYRAGRVTGGPREPYPALPAAADRGRVTPRSRGACADARA